MSEFVVDIGRGKTVRLPTSGKYCPKDILVVGNPYEKREITDCALTAAEKTILTEYLPGGYFTPSRYINTMYATAGIDLEPIFGKLGFFDILRKLFDVDTGQLLPESERDKTFSKMLVPLTYGGNRAALSDCSDIRQDELKIGDIFLAAQEAPCRVNNVRWVYFCGIYQGYGKFLMAENHSNKACVDCNKLYVDDAANAEITAVWKNVFQLRSAYRYYFVLRPENLATT